MTPGDIVTVNVRHPSDLVRGKVAMVVCVDTKKDRHGNDTVLLLLTEKLTWFLARSWQRVTT